MIARPLPIVVLLLGLVAGCADRPTPSLPVDEEKMRTTDEQPLEQPAKPNASFTHVVITETVYYITGPQQGRPPDGSFQVGTKVKVIKEAGNYPLVRSENGIEAYVLAAALKPIEERESVE